MVENKPDHITHNKDELQHVVLNATSCVYEIIKRLCKNSENSKDENDAKEYLMRIEQAIKCGGIDYGGF